MSIKDILENNKIIREGKKIHFLNKSVELMNFIELQKELSYLIYKNRNSTSLDNRTAELLKEYFSYREGTFWGLNNALSCISSFSQESVKKQVFDIYTNLNVLPREYLDTFFYNPIFLKSKEEIHEEKINHLKFKINNFTDKITKPFRQVKSGQSITENPKTGMFFGSLIRYKKNPFELQKSTKVADRIHNFELYLKSQFIIKNIEQFDFDKFFDHYKYNKEMIKSVFNLLPEDKKAYFCGLFMSSEASRIDYNTEYIELFKNYMSQEDLIDFYISNDFNEDLQASITDENILDYYIKHSGSIPFNYKKRLKRVMENIDFSEIQILLEKIDPEKSSMFDILYQLNVNDEEYTAIEKNERIAPAIKDKIFRIKISESSDENKLSIYKNLTPEQQKKFNYVFLFSSSKEEKFITSFISDTKDEELKRLLIIKYNTKDATSIDEAVYFINHCKEYDLEIDTDRIKKFTDSEIEEIYERIDDEDFKAELLRVNRKIGKYFNNTSNMTNEEIEKFNNSQPNSVLVNKNTIKKYLSTAKSASCYYNLLVSEEIKDLNFSEILEILNDFVEKEDFLIESKVYKISEAKDKLVSLATEKADLKERYALFEKGFFTKQCMLDLIKYYDFDSKNTAKDFAFIESISDVDVKKKLLQQMNYCLQKKSTSFTSSKQEYESIKNTNTRNYYFLNKIYKEKILDKNISVENKYLYLSTLFDNYYNNEMVKANKELVSKKALEIQELFSLINDEAQKQDYNFMFKFEPQYVEGDFRKNA